MPQKSIIKENKSNASKKQKKKSLVEVDGVPLHVSN